LFLDRTSVFAVVLARLDRSSPLLAEIVDDLLQTLARISFAVSRGYHATGRVDPKICVQIALLIQRLCLQYTKRTRVENGTVLIICGVRCQDIPDYAFVSSG
jgi:hypothetical protein